MDVPVVDKTRFETLSQEGHTCQLLCFVSPLLVNPDMLAAVKKSRQVRACELEVYYVADRDLDYFQRRYEFWGTPIFLLTRNGREVSRLLGEVTETELDSFIQRNLQNHDEQ